MWLLRRMPSRVHFFADGDGGGDGGDGGGGGGAPALDKIPGAPEDPLANWRDSLSTELQNNESIKSLKDITALAQSFIDTKRMVGESIRINKDMKPEELDKNLYSKIGWPEKVDGYTRLENKDEKGEKLFSDDFGDFWYNTAHKHRLNNKQANEFMKDLHVHQMDIQSKEDIDLDTKQAEAKTLMETKYGAALTAKLEQAKRFLVQFAGEDFLERMNGNNWNNDPGFLTMMIELSSQWVQDTSISTQRGDLSLNSSPEALKERVKEIEATEEYKNPSHIRHKDALAKRSKLYDMLFPDKV